MALNRIALAAALLEYDNDNPASGLAPRHAQQSAILRGAREAAVVPPTLNGRNRQRQSVVEDRGSTYGYVPGRRSEDKVEELDMAEVDLAEWGLPDTLLPDQDAPQARPPLTVTTSGYTYKPATASAEGRKHRKGRTVSFHAFPSIPHEEDGVEELRQQEPEEAAERPRPRSSMSMMNRGRPTSPFTAPSPTSATFSPIDVARGVPLPPSPGPTAPPHIEQPEDEVNPFALPAPAGPRLSRFDPKSTPVERPRPVSTASGYFPSMEPHQPPHQPPAPVSRLRPRTLIMPSPLHGVLDPTQNQPPTARDGFTHGVSKPLPPGALTRPDSFVGRMGETPSQRAFRGSLAVVGARDARDSAGYTEGIPPSAEREGEIAVQQFGGRVYGDDEEEEEGDEGEEGWRPETRYVRGPSLMDRLEARKAELKGKNRQFKGDNRPAMMSRPGPLVDLAPTSPGAESLQLQDDSGRPLVRSPDSLPVKPGMPRGKSVFGVDTVWERELRKVELQREEARARRETEERKGQKGKRGKGKEVHPHTETLHEQGRDDTAVPPSLSLGDLAAVLNAPEPAESVPHKLVSVDEWAAGSDEEQPVQMPRRRKKRTVKPVVESGSEGDDVPLATAFGLRNRAVAEDSSEDEPLSNLKKKVSNRTLDAADEDDIPLAVRRAKKAAPTLPAEVDEDDLPLAQRRLRAQQTGATDPAAQQQQQLAMAMAQQQHQSMMFNPMSMYGMPMMGMPGMGMPGMGLPTPSMGMPPPMGWNGIGDASSAPSLDPKIDRWRREVEAREGSISVPPSIITSGGRS